MRCHTHESSFQFVRFAFSLKYQAEVTIRIGHCSLCASYNVNMYSGQRILSCIYHFPDNFTDAGFDSSLTALVYTLVVLRRNCRSKQYSRQEQKK